MNKIDEYRLAIEPLDKRDESYKAFVDIENAHFPQYPETAENVKRRDSRWQAKYHFYRCVARDVATREILAVGAAHHDRGSFHPQKFWVGISVKQGHEGNGIGRKLYSHLLDHLAPLNPTILEAATASDKARSIRFIEDRGYELKTRAYSSKLDLNTFDPTAFANYSERCRAAGIDIINYDELQARYPDEWGRRLYDATNEINEDVPWHDAVTPLPYEEWLDRYNTYPNRIPEAFLLAMDGDEIVGVTMVAKNDATADTLFTGLTGVKRSHRRKGIAIALKCQSLDYCKTHFRNSKAQRLDVMTENEANNPMYTINERVGFVRQPDFLMYRKEL